MSYELMEESPTQISKYNDAKLSIFRLNELWMRAEDKANKGNLVAWKFLLDGVRRELAPDIRRLLIGNNKVEAKKLLNKDELLIIKIAHNPFNRHLTYHLLHKRHCLLKEIQDLCGKAGVYADENEEGFE